ncbi:MAG: ABC transporter permease [Bacilli bacterium]|nr:ABC transporter permease [Bacilli bacterium]
MSEKVLTQEEVNLRLKQKDVGQKVKKVSALTFVWIMLVIMYLPIIYLIIYSFTDAKIIGQWTNFNFNSYTRLFSPTNTETQKLWEAAWNTIWVALVSATLSTILGTAGAIGMHYLGKKLKTTMNLATQIPIVNAEIVMALSLVILFVFLGLPTSAFSLIIGHMVLTIPFVVINVQPKLEQMDPSLYEAALDLGANRTESLFKVIIPDIFPGILSGFMVSLTLSLDDYVITEFTKPTTSNFNTISTYVQSKLAKGSIPIQLRSFTALLFVIIVVAMIGYMIYTVRKSKKKL